MKIRLLLMALLLFTPIAVVIATTRTACPLASHRRESDEQLRIHTQKRLDHLLKLRAGEPYDRWDEADKIHYRNIRATLAELGVDISEEPAESP